MALFRLYASLINSDMPRMKHAAAWLLLFVVFGMSVLSGYLFPSVLMIIPLSVSSALFSAVLFMYRSHAVYAVPALSAFVLIFISDTPVSVLLPIMMLPLSVSLTLAFYCKQSKSRAVFYGAVSLGGAAFAGILVMYLFGADVIPDIDSLRDGIKTALSAITINTREGRAALFTPESASGIADYVILSIPAIVIVSLNLVSFLSASLLSVFCRIFFFADSIPDGKWEYTPECVSAVIYVISYFVSAATVSLASADVIGFAAENVLLALLPAMLLAGAKSSFVTAVRHDRRVLFVILSFLAVTLAPSLYLMVISFWGAISVIWRSVGPFVVRVLPFGKNGDDDGENGE